MPCKGIQLETGISVRLVGTTYKPGNKQLIYFHKTIVLVTHIVNKREEHDS